MLLLMDTQVVDTFVEKHKAQQIVKDAAATSSLFKIKVPKLTKKNWKDFHCALIETFGRWRGVSSVPFSYVIQANEVNDYKLAYKSTEMQLIACLRHNGKNYNTDRKDVYSILVEQCKDSEIESIVDQFANTRNGRLAWLAILNHMQSPSYMDSLKTAATSRIKNAHYQGEKRDFGIAKYCTIHSSVHNNLQTNFCNGLKASVAVNYAITTKSEPTALASFDAFYNSFSAKLLSHITLVNASSASSSRSINLVQHVSRGRGGGRRCGRGRDKYQPYGRGRGPGRGCGRGGRNRGDYNSNSTPWQPENRDYPDDKWYALSYSQQRHVRDLRRAMNGYGSSQNNKENGNERQINATETEQSSVPGEVSIGRISIQSQTGRAGDAFAPRQNNSGSCSTRSDGGASC